LSPKWARPKQFIKFHEPEYKVIPQGGYAQGFQYGVPIPGGPSTTQPPQPGGQGGPPQPGAIVNGYRFKGGAVNDPQSWEAAGGAGSGPQTFQPVGGTISANEAAPILRNAQSTGTISRMDAERVRSALGANGGESFQQWLAQHNIRIANQ
jgi:hypothetical protein